MRANARQRCAGRGSTGEPTDIKACSWGDDFEDWEKKPAVPEKKVLLQNLDDFDGLAPPPEPKKDDEPGARARLGAGLVPCPL